MHKLREFYKGWCDFENSAFHLIFTSCKLFVNYQQIAQKRLVNCNQIVGKISVTFQIVGKCLQIVRKILEIFLQLIRKFRTNCLHILTYCWKLFRKLLTNWCQIVVKPLTTSLKSFWQIVDEWLVNCQQNVGKLSANCWPIVGIVLKIFGNYWQIVHKLF